MTSNNACTNIRCNSCPVHCPEEFQPVPIRNSTTPHNVAPLFPMLVHYQSPVIIEITDDEPDNAAPWISVASYQTPPIQAIQQAPPFPTQQRRDNNQTRRTTLHPQNVVFPSNTSHNIIRGPVQMNPSQSVPIASGSLVAYASGTQHFSSATIRPAPAILILSPDGRRVLSAPSYEFSAGPSPSVAVRAIPRNIIDSSAPMSVALQPFDRNNDPRINVPFNDFMHSLRMFTTVETYAKGNEEQEQRIGLLDVCSICLDTFQDKCNLRYLHCRHVFHQPCADQWLIQKMSCPVCRRELRRE